MIPINNGTGVIKGRTINITFLVSRATENDCNNNIK